MLSILIILLSNSCFAGVMSMSVTSQIVEVGDYWPEVREDLSQVVWSHATNSHQVGDMSVNILSSRNGNDPLFVQFKFI